MTRVAIVTGGGRGIGAATAARLSARGYRVAVVGRREAPLLETVASIRGSGGTALAVRADLAERDAPRTVVETVAERWGQADVVVNSAAVIATKYLVDVTIEEFDWHMAVNVRAPYFLVQAAIPYLQRSENPCVADVSSSAASSAALTLSGAPHAP